MAAKKPTKLIKKLSTKSMARKTKAVPRKDTTARSKLIRGGEAKNNASIHVYEIQAVNDVRPIDKTHMKVIIKMINVDTGNQLAKEGVMYAGFNKQLKMTATLERFSDVLVQDNCLFNIPCEIVNRGIGQISFEPIERKDVVARPKPSAATQSTFGEEYNLVYISKPTFSLVEILDVKKMKRDVVAVKVKLVNAGTGKEMILEGYREGNYPVVVNNLNGLPEVLIDPKLPYGVPAKIIAEKGHSSVFILKAGYF